MLKHDNFYNASSQYNYYKIMSMILNCKKINISKTRTHVINASFVFINIIKLRENRKEISSAFQQNYY